MFNNKELLEALDNNTQTIARLLTALNYVADMTCINAQGEWEFKPNYDPQIVLDAIEQIVHGTDQ